MPGVDQSHRGDAHGDDRSSAGSVDETGSDHHRHRRHERRHHRPTDEQDDGTTEHGTNAVAVHQWTGHHRRHPRHQQIPGHHPGQQMDVTQVGGDLRQGGGDGETLEGSERHRGVDGDRGGEEFPGEDAGRLGGHDPGRLRPKPMFESVLRRWFSRPCTRRAGGRIRSRDGRAAPSCGHRRPLPTAPAPTSRSAWRS